MANTLNASVPTTPNRNPALVEVDRDKALDWLQKGAQPSDTARAILSYTGVVYRNHLQNGVKKGAFDQAEADRRFDGWLLEKQAKVESKRTGVGAQAEKALKERTEAERKKSEDRAAALIAKMNAQLAETNAAAAPPRGGGSRSHRRGSPGRGLNEQDPRSPLPIRWRAFSCRPAPHAGYLHPIMEEEVLHPLGKLGKPWGHQGELTLHLEGAEVDDIRAMGVLFVDLDGQHVPFFVSRIREHARTGAVVQFDELDRPQAVAFLVNREVFAPPGRAAGPVRCGGRRR
jgi:hypothetical protein